MLAQSVKRPLVKWPIWRKIDKLFFEIPCKGATAKEKDDDVWLKINSYTGAKLWNDLLPVLNNDVEFGVFKSSLKILSTDHLDPTFTYV